jgi:dipeptidyl aminopeptidase/acylaminoacyl peptidase
VAWSPDGARLATGGATATVWDAAGGRELLTLRLTGTVQAVAWSPDGKRLATGGNDGTKVWEMAGGRELLTLQGQTGKVTSVAWSPDGARLAAGGDDGMVRVWEAADAEAAQQWSRQDRALQDLQARNEFRGPQAQGFLQNWLMLLPLPFAAGETEAQALDRQQLPGEAQARPRAGERVTLGGGTWVWQEYRSPKSVVNFHAALGRATKRSVVYAACYVESARAHDGLWLQVGSPNQAKVYLNGRQIHRDRLPPGLASLDTVGPVRLERGINVLLLKVVYEQLGDWEGCARLVDDEDWPVQGLRVTLAP